MMRLGVLLVGLGALLASCTQSGSGNVSLKNDDDKFSYIIGQNIGNGLKNQGLTVNPDILASAIKDVMKGVPSKVSPQEMQQIMGKMQAKMMEKQKGAAPEDKAKADKFLAENKSKSRCHDDEIWFAVPNPHRRKRPLAEGDRCGQSALPRNPPRWHRVRQLLQARPAG